MLKETPEGATTETQGGSTSLQGLLNDPTKGLRARVKGLVAVVGLMIATPSRVGSENIGPQSEKFPPKPGEDDGIYSEGIARAQGPDF